MQLKADTTGRVQVKSLWNTRKGRRVHKPCWHLPSQPAFYWAHIQLDRQLRAGMEVGRHVLRDALQGFAAQTHSCISCPGLFIFQIQLPESGRDVASSTAPSASLLITDTAFPPKSGKHMGMARGRDTSPKEREGSRPGKDTISYHQPNYKLGTISMKHTGK